MPNLKTKSEPMLFDYETTNRTCYQTEEIKAPVKTAYKEKPRCVMVRPPPVKDVHTLSDWKTTGIPFSLLHKRKDIVGTNPYEIPKRYERTQDLDRERIQKTRPRLVMTPAVSMDDIEDPEARRILCNDMYTSDMTRGLREAVSPYFSVQAPFPDHPASANPIFLPPCMPPVVSPEWRMETVSWDGRQVRSYTDPTKEFWLAHKLNRRRCEPMLFNYETTGRTDFKEYDFRANGMKTDKTVYQKKARGTPYCRPAQKFVHTMTEWKKPIAPIDLLVRPKDIVHTNPHKVQEAYSEPPDLEKEQVIRTRPRLVMTPATSLDDIEDKRSRELLIKETYQTSAMQMWKETQPITDGVGKSPLPGIPASPLPITLSKLRPSYVSPEWRMDSARWEKDQLRTYCDVTREFWMSRNPNIFERCQVCTDSAARASLARRVNSLKGQKNQ